MLIMSLYSDIILLEVKCMAYIDNYPNGWKDGYSSADVAQADAPAGLLAFQHPALKGGQLLLVHARTVVGHGYVEHVPPLPDPQEDASALLPAGKAVDKGVLHNGLEGERGDAHPKGVHLHLLFVGDAPVEAGLLDVDVILQGLKLLGQKYLLLLGPQVVAENAAQGQDHFVRIGGILQPGHAGDQVQGVEQEMGVDLALEHFEPGVIQILLQLQALELLAVEVGLNAVFLLQGGDVIPGGVLHAVEGADELTHLVVAGNGEIRQVEIVVCDVPGLGRHVLDGTDQ